MSARNEFGTLLKVTHLFWLQNSTSHSIFRSGPPHMHSLTIRHLPTMRFYEFVCASKQGRNDFLPTGLPFCKQILKEYLRWDLATIQIVAVLMISCILVQFEFLLRTRNLPKLDEPHEIPDPALIGYWSILIV